MCKQCVNDVCEHALKPNRSLCVHAANTYVQVASVCTPHAPEPARSRCAHARGKKLTSNIRVQAKRHKAVCTRQRKPASNLRVHAARLQSHQAASASTCQKSHQAASVRTRQKLSSSIRVQSAKAVVHAVTKPTSTASIGTPHDAKANKQPPRENMHLTQRPATAWTRRSQQPPATPPTTNHPCRFITPSALR